MQCYDPGRNWHDHVQVELHAFNLAFESSVTTQIDLYNEPLCFDSPSRYHSSVK